MRVLIQRVSRGLVRVDALVVGEIGSGLVLLVGVGREDTAQEADRLAAKTAGLRIFKNEMGKMDLSLLDAGGEALVISQFTLYANASKGRRPNFTQAAPPEHARSLIDHFVTALEAMGVQRVATGVFGAMMDVEIHNSGPVTIWLDSADL